MRSPRFWLQLVQWLHAVYRYVDIQFRFLSEVYDVRCFVFIFSPELLFRLRIIGACPSTVDLIFDDD